MTKAVNFGPLIRVSHPQVIERTFAAWIYLTVVSGGTKAIIAPFADSGGVLMYVSNQALVLYSNRHNVSPGAWNSTTTSIAADTWQHVAVAYNHTSTTNDPLMWINGIPQTVNEIYTPAGSLNRELGTHVVIGNVNTATQDYTYKFEGQIYDARIYNRIITAAEALELYNGGTPSMAAGTKDGLVLQGFAVLDGEAADYIDQDVSDKAVFDVMYKQVGQIVNIDRTTAITGRAAP